MKSLRWIGLITLGVRAYGRYAIRERYEKEESHTFTSTKSSSSPKTNFPMVETTENKIPTLLITGASGSIGRALLTSLPKGKDTEGPQKDHHFIAAEVP